MNVLAVDCSSDSLCVAVRRTSAGISNYPSRRESACRGVNPKHPFREINGHASKDGIVILEIDAGLRHAQRILPAMELCLKEAGLERSNLDLLACASGPGSFTGLRIALSTVKGISAALGIPFVSVPTLDCIAADWEGVCPVILPVLDAQHGHFYTSIYERGHRIAEYLDIPLVDLLALTDTFPEVLVVGPDADLFRETEETRPGLQVARYARRNSARVLLDLAVSIFLAEGPGLPDTGPIYVRKSDAEEHEQTER